MEFLFVLFFACLFLATCLLPALHASSLKCASEPCNNSFFMLQCQKVGHSSWEPGSWERSLCSHLPLDCLCFFPNTGYHTHTGSTQKSDQALCREPCTVKVIVLQPLNPVRAGGCDPVPHDPSVHGSHPSLLTNPGLFEASPQSLGQQVPSTPGKVSAGLQPSQTPYH